MYSLFHYNLWRNNFETLFWTLRCIHTFVIINPINNISNLALYFLPIAVVAFVAWVTWVYLKCVLRFTLHMCNGYMSWNIVRVCTSKGAFAILKLVTRLKHERLFFFLSKSNRGFPSRLSCRNLAIKFSRTRIVIHLNLYICVVINIIVFDQRWSVIK